MIIIIYNRTPIKEIEGLRWVARGDTALGVHKGLQRVDTEFLI